MRKAGPSRLMLAAARAKAPRRMHEAVEQGGAQGGCGVNVPRTAVPLETSDPASRERARDLARIRVLPGELESCLRAGASERIASPRERLRATLAAKGNQQGHPKNEGKLQLLLSGR